MAVRYKRELVRSWFGASKKEFDSCMVPNKTLSFDEVASAGWIFNGAWQLNDNKKLVNLTKKIAIERGAEEPVVLPQKIALSKVLAGETKGMRKDAIAEAQAFAKRVGSGAEPPPPPARKPPKAPATPPKKIKSKLARGVALVELAIAKLPGKKGVKSAAKLTLDGKKLPASLARWLEHDTSRVECFAKNKLDKSTLVELAEMLQLEIEPDQNPLPGGDCYLLFTGADMLQFLYVGRADATGEYPVMTLDTDDTPVVILEAPGFDVWIARFSEALEADDVYGAVPKGYEPFMTEAARLNLGGKKELEIY